MVKAPLTCRIGKKRMSQVSRLLSEDVFEKAINGLKNLGKQGLIATRLQIIIAAKNHGITDVCRIHGLSRTTLTGWIKRLKTTGLVESLKNQPKQRKSPLTPHMAILKEWIGENSTITAQELMLKVQEKLGLKVSKSAIYRAMKRLKFSYITPRPRHYKRKKGTEEVFKKKSEGCS